jgi:hypothetical protein
MPAATLEESSGDRAPVFVAGGHGRTHAVRVGAAGLGLLLAAWLVALTAGLAGFSSLPQLAVPGSDASQPAPPPPDRSLLPAAQRGVNAHVSPLPQPASRGGDASSANGGSAANASGGGIVGATAGGGAQSASGPDGSPPASSGGGGSSQPQPSAPPGAPAQTGSGNPPAFTPPASGQKSAHPPRGNSANAPGRTVSADPPGKAMRTHSG